jgi:hypothetical protein
MKLLTIAAALMLSATVASASTECVRLGNSNNWKCPTGGMLYTVANAATEADARATANAHQKQKQQQGQTQGQNQSSSNVNDNSNSSTNTNRNSISNVIEGNPAHTTSFNVGVGVSVRFGEGVRANAVLDAADRLERMGQKCLALEAMLKLHPDLKKLKKTVNCKK